MQTNITTQRSARKGGAALIIVIAMTGMLAFLGFFFFSYVAAERNSASWFATSKREAGESDYFDFALQQILIGPTDDLKSSALSGRKWSMLPNLIGTFGPDLKPDDYYPGSGRGVDVTFEDSDGDGFPDNTATANTEFNFDYDGDGTGETKILNFSPAANPVTGNNIPATPLGNPRHPNYVADFEPDAGYTYPDINSMFLGYFSIIDVNPDPNSEDLRKVWIPSFHRPQYLPRETTTNIYTDANFANRVLRPHASHRVEFRELDGSGDVTARSVPRYVGAGGFDDGSGPTRGFPSHGVSGYPAYNPGIWTDYTATLTDDIQYDVDADGWDMNGAEAILMDLNHGVEILETGTTPVRRIPMYAITIMDADGLINLNTAGNLYGEPDSLMHNRDGSDPFGDDSFISKSNYGLSASEINPGRALYRPRNATGTFPLFDSYPSPNYEEMFGLDLDAGGDEPVNMLDMSNMELARILIGSSNGDTADTTDLIDGRWGEKNLLDAAVKASRDNIGSTSIITAPRPAYPAYSFLSSTRFPGQFPAPGQTGVDDDEDYFIGGGKARLASSRFRLRDFAEYGIDIPPSVHPVDELGIGRDLYLTADIGEDDSFELDVTFNNRGMLRQTFRTTDLDLAAIEDDHQVNPGRWAYYSDYNLEETKFASSSTPAAQKTDKNGSGGMEYQLGVDPNSARPGIGDEVTINPVAGVRPWAQTGFGNLLGWGELHKHRYEFSGGTNDWGLYLYDEPDEVIVEPAYRNESFDSLYNPADMLFLHLEKDDWDTIGGDNPSRLQDLAAFNFERDTGTSVTSYSENNSYAVRSQFTTSSWDRLEFSLPRPQDTDLDGEHIDEVDGWLFNDDLSTPAPVGQEVWSFPPTFADTSSQDHAPGRIYDPFRPEVRRWIRVQFGNQVDPTTVQQKLNLNRLLVFDPQNNELYFRQLTPHPVGTIAAGSDDLDQMVHQNVVNPFDGSLPYPFSAIRNSEEAQEWWARYDRQRLARDIYVMLYTMGGNRVFNLSTEEGRRGYTGNNDSEQLYTEDQCREMAQFAVNVVDALDRDSVITEFVYDMNLGDGWNIEGEKEITGSPSVPVGTLIGTIDADQAGRVYGVEMQSLTLSESLWIETEDEGTSGSDHSVTPFEDNTGNIKTHLFVELQNASPFPVELSGGNWRLRRVETDNSSTPPQDRLNTARSIVFTDENTSSYSTTTGDLVDQANIVEPGGFYTVGAHNAQDPLDPMATPTAQAPSDYTYESGTSGGNPTYQRLAPAKWARWRNSTATAPAAQEAGDRDAPWVDLDLTWDNNSERDRYQYYDQDESTVANDDPSTEGYLARELTSDVYASPTVTFILERRMHLALPDNLDNNNYNNPWIEVDRTTVERTTMDPAGTPADEFDNLVSQEILEPLKAETTSDSTAAATLGRNEYNTLGYRNSVSDDHFTVFQPHFDRDFTSVYDLLTIPMFGPSPRTVDPTNGDHLQNAAMETVLGGVTRQLTNGYGVISGYHEDPVSGTTVPVLAGPAKFLRPDDDPTATGNEENDNLWYRLFEFYEVENTTQFAIRDNLRIPRTPGKINLNTIRHPGVLAGLIDDNYHLDDDKFVAITPASEENTYRIPFQQLEDRKESTRHWGQQFFYSRDVSDPIANNAASGNRDFALPGIPGSRPFRPLSYKRQNLTTRNDIAELSVEQTILRGLPLDLDNYPNSSFNITNAPEDNSTRRRLFEARTTDDYNIAATGLPTQTDTKDIVDYHTRHRLLSKIANNSTVRSNVFYCWIQVQFHEAAEDEFGNVQVGGNLSDSTHPDYDPVHDPKRAFFVIDRSKLEEAWDPQTRSFDWRKFVTLRREIKD